MVSFWRLFPVAIGPCSDAPGLMGFLVQGSATSVGSSGLEYHCDRPQVLAERQRWRSCNPLAVKPSHQAGDSGSISSLILAGAEHGHGIACIAASISCSVIVIVSVIPHPTSDTNVASWVSMATGL